jgi:hypothetical protein
MGAKFLSPKFCLSPRYLRFPFRPSAPRLPRKTLPIPSASTPSAPSLHSKSQPDAARLCALAKAHLKQQEGNTNEI